LVKNHKVRVEVGYRTTHKHCNKKLTIPDEAPVINTTLSANASLGGVERVADAKLVFFLSDTKSLPIAMHEKRLVKPPIAAKTAVVCCCDCRRRKSRRLKRRDPDEEVVTISSNFVEYKSVEGLRYPNFIFLFLLNLLFNVLVG